jgi:peptidoglycan hydrolase-like protein with peptidoglycan-binding domain
VRVVKIGRLVLVFAVLVGVATVVLIERKPRASTPTQQPASPATTTVTRTNLAETFTVDGNIRFGPATPLQTALSGTVTAVPSAGSVVRAGQRLYSLDARPVVLMSGGLPAYRALQAGTRGQDVRELEQNLAAAGYRGFSVDDRFTSATARAVRRWQRANGLVGTGVIELGRVVFVPGSVRVDEVEVAPGQAVGPGTVIFNHTSTARTIQADLAVEQSQLARPGDRVGVTVPGRPPVSGVIANVGTTIQQAPPADAGSTPDQTSTPSAPTVPLTITVSNQAALGTISGSPAEVELTGQRRTNVLTVPVAALLALSEGGYGLDVIAGQEHRIVAVRTGLFANGRVEVTGRGLVAGTVVGMAA